MKPSQVFATDEPCICAVCWDRAVFLGYTPHDKKKPIWLCRSPECHALGEKVYQMSEQKYDAYVRGAISESVTELYTACEEIGGTPKYWEMSETDMADAFWRQFKKFGQTMRKRISAGEAPF